MTIVVEFKSDREDKEFTNVGEVGVSVDSERDALTTLHDTRGTTTFLGSWPTDEIDSIYPK